MRLKRVFDARLVLIADDHINYTPSGEPKSLKFAYFDDPELKEMLVKAIKEDRQVNLLIERREKGKLFDYVIGVTVKHYETPSRRSELLGDRE